MHRAPSTFTEDTVHASNPRRLDEGESDEEKLDHGPVGEKGGRKRKRKEPERKQGGGNPTACAQCRGTEREAPAISLHHTTNFISRN